jgi:DNA-binding MarR family transcriptional regulator
MHAENPEDVRDEEGTTTEVFDTDRAITFQISVLSNLIARPFYSAVGQHSGISLNDWRLMLVIASHPGLSQAEIVYSTGFNKSNVSRQLNSLGKYVRLEPHPFDNRKQAVYLTDAGWHLYRQNLPALKWRQELLTKSLPPADIVQFQETLEKLVTAARQWSVTLDSAGQN